MEFINNSHRYGDTIEESIHNIITKIEEIDNCFLNYAPRAGIESKCYYRGMKDTYYLDFNAKIKADKVGDIFEVSNYTSITKDIDVALDFSDPENNCCLYEIYLSEGLPFIDMALTTKFIHEKEILLPRNIFFKIINIDENYKLDDDIIVKYTMIALPKDKNQFSQDMSSKAECRLFELGAIQVYNYQHEGGMREKKTKKTKKNKQEIKKKSIKILKSKNKQKYIKKTKGKKIDILKI